MEKICDLHIHSRYSGGTSNLINVCKLAQNCRLKGIDIVGTGDCFHPLWLKEIQLNLEEGFNFVHAVETGLSADPTMIRGILELNKLSIISNSDSHSLNFHRLGREVTVLDLNRITYRDIIKSIRENKVVKTYEFNPSEGKYYYDGHRSTRHSSSKSYFCSPKRKLIYCPICGNNLTKGVLSRVYELKDSVMPINENFQYIIPLLHLISIVYGGSEYNKKNLSLYRSIVEATNGEFNIWENSTDFYPISYELCEAVNKIKSGRYWFIPGYDGVYGKLQLGQSVNSI